MFSLDEKSRIQALNRTQPDLPLEKGSASTMTHDYKRRGTTTLLAALEVASGKVIGKTYCRHRHEEVLRSRREVDKAVPANQEIHIVLDNYDPNAATSPQVDQARHAAPAWSSFNHHCSSQAGIKDSMAATPVASSSTNRLASACRRTARRQRALICLHAAARTTRGPPIRGSVYRTPLPPRVPLPVP